MSTSSRAVAAAQQDLTFQLNALALLPTINGPRGVYVSRDSTDPLVLHGVVFVNRSGPYDGGAFRFKLVWVGGSVGAHNGPSPGKGHITTMPDVRFEHGINHPLVHPGDHRLNLAPRFTPPWQPRQKSHHTLSHLLFYISEVFGAGVLESEVKRGDKFWANEEIGRLLRDQPKAFEKLAKQSVQYANSKAVFFDDDGGGDNDDSNGSKREHGELKSPFTGRPRFSKRPLDDAATMQIRKDIFGDEDGREEESSFP
ncbi:unnamed protein product [Jaminaea pallidilutea]